MDKGLGSFNHLNTMATGKGDAFTPSVLPEAFSTDKFKGFSIQNYLISDCELISQAWQWDHSQL